MWSCTEESSPSQSSPLANASPQSITTRTQWEEDDDRLATWDPRDLHRPSVAGAEVDAVPLSFSSTMCAPSATIVRAG
jgi:hypothetical protein